MAESEGFEPPIALRLCLISSQVHSTGLCQLSARPMPGNSAPSADLPQPLRVYLQKYGGCNPTCTLTLRHHFSIRHLRCWAPWGFATKASSAEAKADCRCRQTDQKRDLDKDFASIEEVRVAVFEIGIGEDAVQEQQNGAGKNQIVQAA